MSSCLVFFKGKKGKKSPVVKMQKKNSEEDFKRKLKHPSSVPRGMLEANKRSLYP